MKKLHAVTVKGRSSEWSINTMASEETAQDWRDDGLEVFEVYYSIPSWVGRLGLTRQWCFLQDIFNFRNPWRG